MSDEFGNFWEDPIWDGCEDFEDPNFYLPITEQLAKFREECELNQELELLNKSLELNFIPKS